VIWDDPENRARGRVGAALRRLGHAVVGRHATVDHLERVADVLNGLSDGLEPGQERRREPTTFGAQFHPQPLDGSMSAGFPDRPFSGPSSPWGLDMTVTEEGGEAVARFTLGASHEGAPGRGHGGITAAAFDDVLGFVLNIEHVPAYTGELAVRYVRPAPLHRPLEMRARLDRHEGRKLYVTGDLWDGEIEIARATGLFIVPREWKELVADADQ
jgi:acyl-coenzyme A thioesterase PaaI-like protein